MLRRVFALLLLGLLASGVAHARDAKVAAADSHGALVQQYTAPDCAGAVGADSACPFVCPGSACIGSSSAGHRDFGMTAVRPPVFLARQARQFFTAPDTAPPRLSSL
jgi:hypothetical protein